MTDLAKSRAELALISRMKAHGVRIKNGAIGVTEGTTTPDMRKQRLREAIRDSGLSEVICGRGKDKASLTYSEAFTRLFNEPL